MGHSTRGCGHRSLAISGAHANEQWQFGAIGREVFSNFSSAAKEQAEGRISALDSPLALEEARPASGPARRPKWKHFLMLTDFGGPQMAPSSKRRAASGQLQAERANHSIGLEWGQKRSIGRVYPPSGRLFCDQFLALVPPTERVHFVAAQRASSGAARWPSSSSTFESLVSILPLCHWRPSPPCTSAAGAEWAGRPFGGGGGGGGRAKE